jgi:hypothetical protein
MSQEEFCQGCNQKNQCQGIYRKLANTKDPSVVFKVIVAFLLPILLFIVLLIISEKIFSDILNLNKLYILLSFLVAISVTFVFMLLIKALNKQSNKDSQIRQT